MINKIAVFMFIGLSILLLSGVIYAQEYEKQIYIDEIVQIDLIENSSTGYQWYCEIEDEDIVSIAKDEFNIPGYIAGIPGAGGTRSLYFLAKEEGQTKINFKLLRNEKEEALRTKTYTVNVKPYDMIVRKNHLFTIEISENPSTGYKWHLVDNSDIALLDEKFHQDEDNKEGVVGGPGTRSWSIFALQPGEITLEFELYRRPEDIEEKKEYTIIICD